MTIRNILTFCSQLNGPVELWHRTFINKRHDLYLQNSLSRICIIKLISPHWNVCYSNVVRVYLTLLVFICGNSNIVLTKQSFLTVCRMVSNTVVTKKEYVLTSRLLFIIFTEVLLINFFLIFLLFIYVKINEIVFKTW